MERLLDIVTTLCIGLMIGTEFAVSVFINPILGKLEQSAEAQATRLFALKLGAIMPFWYGLSLLLLVAEMVVRRHQPGVTLLGAASAIWVGVIVFTVLLLVPINNRIAKMDSDGFTERLRREHRRWNSLHRWRVLALGTAMICLLIGMRL
jgi:uncharacterized membrane protein